MSDIKGRAEMIDQFIESTGHGTPERRCGIDTWDRPRITFVHSIDKNGAFCVDAFWDGTKPEPAMDCSRVRGATSRCRLHESGWYHSQRELRVLTARLSAGLVDWENQLVKAGFTLPLTPELRELQADALRSHREEAKFATDRAHENHIERLEGYGQFTEDGDSMYHPGLDERERAALYCIECALPHGLTDDELLTLLEKVERQTRQVEGSHPQ
jgi:hypothetical protein